MNKLFLIILTTIVALSVFSTASAGERVATILPYDVQMATDKRGNAYTRMTADVTETIQGENFTVTRLLLGFGKVSDCLAYTEEGMEFKALIQKREYQGRTHYQIISVFGCDQIK